MRNLCEEFKHYLGQPLEILCGGGHKICGIVLEGGSDSALIIDKKCRLVRVEYQHITSIIEPQMRLNHPCSGDECQCGCECHHEHGHDDDDDDDNGGCCA